MSASDHGTHTSHDRTGHDPSHGGNEDHGDHGGHGGHDHGDHAAMFRVRFWWSLVLALPVVLTSPMVAGWFGYEVPGALTWVPAALGTVVYLYGGWPFLSGVGPELKDRKPGMMTLVAMAITVAFASSLLASLGAVGPQLDFWWELVLLVVVMLL